MRGHLARACYQAFLAEINPSGEASKEVACEEVIVLSVCLILVGTVVDELLALDS